MHLERLAPLRGLHRLLRNGIAGQLLAGDDVDADVAGAAHEVVDHRPVQDLEPARPRRLAEDDLGDVVRLGVADDVVGDAPVAAGDGGGLAAERLGEAQRIGDAVALDLGEPHAARGLDRERDEGGVQAVGQALGVAHEPGATGVFVDADEDALAGGPRPGDRARLHLAQQLLVDPLGGAAQRELAQRGEVLRREEVLQRALRLVRHVDLAFAQALDEVVRGDVDELDGVGAVEHRVRHGLAHPDPGDLGDDVVQALDVLDVDRGVDVDAVGEDFLDVEVALGVPAAGRVGVGELVDEHDLRVPRDHRVEVHLLDGVAAIADRFAGDDRQALEQRLGFLAPVGLDDADHDVGAVLALGAGLQEHLVGLADAGRGADEDAQLADAGLLAPGCLQERLGRGTLLGIVPLVRHRGSALSLPSGRAVFIPPRHREG